MWQKIFTISLVLIIALSFAACDKEPSVEEVLDGIIAAANDITSVSYDMDAELEMFVSTGAEDAGHIDANMTLNGVMDIENRQIHTDMDVSFSYTDVLSSSTEDSISMDMGMALYLLDETIYAMTDIPMMGVTWQKYSLSAEEIQQIEEMLGGQSLMVNPQMVLEMAEVTIEGSEKIDGVNCHRLKLEMDAEKLWQKIEEMAQDAGEAIPEEFDREILDKIVNSISMKMWVAEDTYYTTRMQMTIDIELNAEDFGDIQVMESVKINASYDILLYDYNKPVTITLPPEAEEAVEVPME